MFTYAIILQVHVTHLYSIGIGDSQEHRLPGSLAKHHC